MAQSVTMPSSLVFHHGFKQLIGYIPEGLSSEHLCYCPPFPRRLVYQTVKSKILRVAVGPCEKLKGSSDAQVHGVTGRIGLRIRETEVGEPLYGVPYSHPSRKVAPC